MYGTKIQLLSEVDNTFAKKEYIDGNSCMCIIDNSKIPIQ